MNYYFLDCFTRQGNTLRDVENTEPFPGVTNSMLRKGKKLSPPENAIAQFYFDPVSKGIIPEMFDLPTFIISPELFAALTQCGVDNIQSWPAIISDQETGEDYEYVLVNILNIVDIIDRSTSQLSVESPPHTAMLYKKISFENAQTENIHLFRPANKRTSIVVSEHVRNYLEGLEAFPYISFHSPENYV